MTRHAKNACSWSVFSHAERARLKYGTQARRAGLEAQKLFNTCELCLTVAQQPVLCQEGHVFCRGCIIECIAEQKAMQKETAAAFAAQEAAKGGEAAQDEAKTAAKHLDMFEKLDAAVLKGNERGTAASANPTAAAAAASSSGPATPAGYVRVSTGNGTGTGYVVDRALVTTLNTGTTTQLAARKEMMPSFWLPSMTPAAESTKISAPSSTCLCPGSNHPLKLKQLKPIKWCLDRTGAATAAADSETSSKAASSSPATAATPGGPMCFSCKKGLSNQTPMVCITKCGHVACKMCVDALMLGKKASSAPKLSSAGSTSAPAPASKSSLICLECDDPCRPDDLVPIVATTGFAATGNTVSKSKVSPAFRC